MIIGTTITLPVEVVTAIGVMILTIYGVVKLVRISLRKEVEIEIMKQHQNGSLPDAEWMKRVVDRLSEVAALTDKNIDLINEVKVKLENGILLRLTKSEGKLDELVVAVNQLIGRLK